MSARASKLVEGTNYFLAGVATFLLATAAVITVPKVVLAQTEATGGDCHQGQNSCTSDDCSGVCPAPPAACNCP